MTETFQQYTARMLALAEGVEPLEVLASTPARIGALMAGRSAEALHWRPDPPRWSIAEIVAHLADAEVVFAYRVRMILSSPGTAIQAFDQNAWSQSQRAVDSDAFASLSLFAVIRRSMLQLLSGLSGEELDRYGLHAERGRESIRHLMKMYAGHDRNHLAQIEERLAHCQVAAPRSVSVAPAKPEIEPAVLERLDVRAGTIRSAQPVAGADRLVALTVDFGDRMRQIVAGMRTERPVLSSVVGVQALFVINLPPKKIRGLLSEGMLFDIGYADGLRPAFAQPEWPMPDGMRAG